MALSPTDFLIEDSTSFDLLIPKVNGIPKGRGYVPRDFTQCPADMFDPPSGMPLIPRSEWSDRIKEMEAKKSRLSDIRGNIPSLDQGQNGYCWAHSTAHCVILTRALSNAPYVPLSAYAVAAIIKGGRNEGGWCGLSAKFLREIGIPDQKYWPQGNRSLSLDTAEMRANAALHKVTEEWVDLSRPVYDVELTFDQLITCLLCRIPCAIDLNWWGHSVCAMDPVEVEPGSFAVRIWNSWSDSWGDRGTGVLRGSRAIPDSAIAIRCSIPALV